MADLTSRELAIKNQLYNQYKENKNSFLKKYGAEAENVMTGRAIKLAKQMAQKENQQKIKEAIRKALMSPIEEIEAEAEEINSVDYIQSRQPVDYNFDSTISLSIPLLIRMMEYAKEDAKTDMDLHFATENMIQLAKTKKSLHMDDYESIVSPYIKID
jgi:hypothetical protein